MNSVYSVLSGIEGSRLLRGGAIITVADLALPCADCAME
jgi:hypothetical protein